LANFESEGFINMAPLDDFCADVDNLDNELIDIDAAVGLGDIGGGGGGGSDVLTSS